MNSTGVQAIQEKREHQILVKHYAITDDVKHNDKGQLAYAAGIIINPNKEQRAAAYDIPPAGWVLKSWRKLLSKPYKERVAIAGALLAAEWDRLHYLDMTDEENE